MSKPVEVSAVARHLSPPIGGLHTVPLHRFR